VCTLRTLDQDCFILRALALSRYMYKVARQERGTYTLLAKHSLAHQ
jgi:hypothetical protein